MAGDAAHWRNVPVFGEGRWVHAGFRRWSHAGIRERLVDALADTPNVEYVLIDRIISKGHPDAGGAKGAEAAAVGRSRGGVTIKLRATVDALGSRAAFARRRDIVAMSRRRVF